MSNWNTWQQNARNFINNGQSAANNNGNGLQAFSNSVMTALIPVGQLLVAIATILLTVMTVVIGIKYMMVKSADEKAKIKVQLIGLIVATMVVYGAPWIWELAQDVMTTIFA